MVILWGHPEAEAMLTLPHFDLELEVEFLGRHPDTQRQEPKRLRQMEAAAGRFRRIRLSSDCLPHVRPAYVSPIGDTAVAS
jgi:hypothetical protein